MASRSGTRATGTDGSDFLNRELIPGHYKVSAANKSRLKWVSIMHILMVMMMLCRLSTSLFVLLGMRPPGFLQQMRFPRAQLWEYVWVCSVAASIMAFVAIRKNRIFLMQHYMLGTITFGVLPVLYAVYDLSDDLLEYWNSRETKALFHGFPLVVLWNMFLAVSLQIHAFGIYFAWQLIKAWKPKYPKKKK